MQTETEGKPEKVKHWHRNEELCLVVKLVVSVQIT